MNQDELDGLFNTQDSLYQEFLKSLDDSNLISHIHELSQSTPKNSVQSSDPFNDGLDEQLLGDIESDTESDESLPKDEETIGRMHSFDDYKTYFEAKTLKQQKKDEEYIKWDLKRRKQQGLDDKLPKKIFEGCAIFVNGYTDPSINQLHRMIILHGGKFVNFLVNKSVATHIICDRLTPKKSIEFRNYKVVKAKWVVDCVEKQELLDWKQYRLISEVAYDQQRLDFKKAKGSDSEEENEGVTTDDDASTLEESQEPLPILNEPPQNAGKGVHQVNNKYVLDARHPDFLPNFFANSRLHHLSMWKADLRLRFLRRIIKENLHKSSQPSNPFKSESPNKYIMHIDFDCFFATASCLKYPNLDINKDPIVVAHGGKTSDVASCNYVARQFGVRNGMWLKQARSLCPKLILLDYEFENYEKYSSEFYNYLISHKEFNTIFPVSIDEALIDITTFVENNQPEGITNLCQTIRRDIFNITKCTVSIGVGSNVLLAKLALRKAKPNGYFHLDTNIKQFLSTVLIKELPGFGPGIIEKLEFNPAQKPTIADLRKFSQHKLIRMLGHRTGMKLFEYSKGIDRSSIEIDTNNPEAMLGRKSVSVDVNFGIRFETVDELDDFLIRLSKEMYDRLINLGICGSQLTLRLAKRAPNASYETTKFLGLGVCEFVNKTSRLGVETNDWGIIGNEIKTLYRMLNIPPKELRGISITLTKLKDAEQINKSRQMKLPFGKVKKIDPKDFNRFEKPKKSVLTGSPTTMTKTPEKSTGHYQSPTKKQSTPGSGRQPPTRFVRQSPLPSPTKVQSRMDNKLVFSRTQIENRKRKNDDDINSIDWEVFQSLPEEIKRELQGELTRRGLIPGPPKPVKENSKVYLQQLIPTQMNKEPKYVRVIESPKKSSPKKQQSISPIKKEPEPIYEESQSYDTSIINELPSSIKESVLKDIEYRKKIKKFDLKSMKEKLNQKVQDRQIDILVTRQWLSEQRKMNKLQFLHEDILLSDLTDKLSNWIEISLDQKGPHVDDINYFISFIEGLLSKNDLNKALILVSEIRKNLSYLETLQFDQFKRDGIQDWYNHLNLNILPVINNYCLLNNIQSIGY